MALGPGKYDDIVTMIRELTEADGVVVAILNGNRGSGFSVMGIPECYAPLPDALRAIADDVERDLANLKKSVTQ